MQPYFEDSTVRLYHGDCIDVMASLPARSVDAIVTDPPYGLGFMGKAWDDLPPGLPWAQECLRVLKPGGHLLAFGGTRTWHRLAVAVEDAGFEVRDSIAWLYGSGFPKSLDVSKAIDKAAGATREVVGTSKSPFRMADPKMGDAYMSTVHGDTRKTDADGYIVREHTAPATPAAQQWQGWGTALKPAFEPIIVARKPLAAPGVNVLDAVESSLRAQGVTGEIKWTSAPASDATRRGQRRSSSSTVPQPAGATSASPADASEMPNGERPTGNGSATATQHGVTPTASTSAPTPDAAPLSYGTKSSLPTATPAPAVTSALTSSSPSTTSTVAGPPTGARSDATSTSSSAARVSLRATESFAGTATGLTGSRATVRIDRLTDGTFVWPEGLPTYVPGGPLTVAANVLEWGTGALNVDGCRVGTQENLGRPTTSNTFLLGGCASIAELEALAESDQPTPDGRNMARASLARYRGFTGTVTTGSPAGRWPANVLLDGDAAAELDEQAPNVGNNGQRKFGAGSKFPGVYGDFETDERPGRPRDKGGASRFFPTFRYQAKAPTRERPKVPKPGTGTDDATSIYTGKPGRQCNVCGSRGKPAGGEQSGKPWPTCGHDDWSMAPAKAPSGEFIAHPTVKPLALMQWLVRLVTPPGGVVLEPFAGSGTTVEAALLEGFRCIAIEREADYLPLIEARIARATSSPATDEDAPPTLFDATA